MNINSNYNVSYSKLNQTIKNNSEQGNKSSISQPQSDTVCFRGKNQSASGLLGLFAKMLGAGAAAGAGFGLFNQSSAEDIAREEFDAMKNMTGFWVDKYSYQPELLEKLLLENEKEGYISPRLFHVSQEKVVRIFSKDTEALKRIYTLDNIIQIENRYNCDDNIKCSRSLLEILGEKSPEFLDEVMFEIDEKGSLPIHRLSKAQNAWFLEDLNKAYSQRLDVLAKMYMTKEEGTDTKYPLEYFRSPSYEIKKELESLKNTFKERHDLLIPILETSGFDELAAQIKEEDANKPLTLLKQTGLSEDTINQALDSLDEHTKNELLDGLNNRKFKNIKDKEAIKELFEAISRQIKDERKAIEITFKLLAQFFDISKDFGSDEEINFYKAIKDIKENGIKIIDTKKLMIDKWGCIKYEYPDRTVLRKTEDIFEYIDDKTKNRVVEHIGRYTKMPDKADKIEKYDQFDHLIETWDEFGNVKIYYNNGQPVKRVMPHGTEIMSNGSWVNPKTGMQGHQDW